MKVKKFKYVDYLWDEAKAAALGDGEIALFLYRFNLLGSDLRITNFGGGNTSCKTIEKDPLTLDNVRDLILVYNWKNCLNDNPGIRGIVLGGISFTF